MNLTWGLPEKSQMYKIDGIESLKSYLPIQKRGFEYIDYIPYQRIQTPPTQKRGWPGYDIKQYSMV